MHGSRNRRILPDSELANRVGASQTRNLLRPMKTELNRIVTGAVQTGWMAGALWTLTMAAGPLYAADTPAPTPWQTGTPIVTYWCGPSLTDAAAQQMADGGWNMVWCGEGELETARRHGLRGQLTHPLLSPAALDNPKQREQLDALIARVRSHPALYAYYITDEPSTAQFAALGRLVAYLRERDPAHLAYINLFPTYASNEQLGNKGDVVTAYRAHLRQFVEQVKPALISYDHYQFSLAGDNPQYFLNLALIRQAALDAGLPFLNIVQSCTWAPKVMRVPTGEEMRYLVYTTLAYGAQGISYYIYTCANHVGGIANADGTPTPLYHALKPLNHEFVAIAKELQPLRSLGVYHAGMMPEGAVPLPKEAVFAFDPPVAPMAYKAPERLKGALVGYFGPAGKEPTHALVVTLDYKTEATLALRGPAPLEVFDATTGQWSPVNAARTALRLPGGGGKLVRVRH